MTDIGKEPPKMRLEDVPGVEMLSTLSYQAMRDSKRWFPGVDMTNLSMLGLCLAGEAGEFANEVKKILRGTSDPKDAAVHHKVAMELTDIFTYTLVAAKALNIDLLKAYQMKRAINEGRWGPKPEENGQGTLGAAKLGG